MLKKVKQPIEIDVHDIEYLICHVGMLWRRLLGTKIKTLGISTTDKRVLFSIGRHPGLTQIEIANHLELEPQNLIRSLDKLESQGWIEKRPRSEDRRVKCLFITPSAKKIIAEIKAMGHAIKPQILAGIDEKKMQILIQQLSLIRENLFKELEAVEEDE